MSEPGQQDWQQEFGQQVARKQQRKIEGRKRARSIWFWLGAMGVIGWSVAMPTVLMTLLGAWADARWPGPMSFTLMGLAAGLAMGLLVAWGWVKKHGGLDEMKRKGRIR